MVTVIPLMKAASTSGPQTGSSPGLSLLLAEEDRLEAESMRGSDTFLYRLFVFGCSGVVKSCAECGLGGRLMLSSFKALLRVDEGGVFSMGDGRRALAGVDWVFADMSSSFYDVLDRRVRSYSRERVCVCVRVRAFV